MNTKDFHHLALLSTHHDHHHHQSSTMVASRFVMNRAVKVSVAAHGHHSKTKTRLSCGPNPNPKPKPNPDVFKHTIPIFQRCKDKEGLKIYKYFDAGEVRGDKISMLNRGYFIINEGAKDDPKIIGFAQFAVNKHNEEANAHLQFVRVLGACSYVGAGMCYIITLEAMDAGNLKQFCAKVVFQSWLNNTVLVNWFEWLPDAKVKQEVPRHQVTETDLETSVNSKVLGPYHHGYIRFSEGGRHDDWIIDLAKFAVNRHNEKVNQENENEDENLQFLRVLGAYQQGVGSGLFHILLEALDAGVPKKLHAVVQARTRLYFEGLKEWSELMPADDAFETTDVNQGHDKKTG